MQPTQQELLNLLQQGVKIWNQQRPHVSIEALMSIHWDDFDEFAYARSWVDLNEVDLSGADLHQIDLSHANLDRAQLREANLSSANLSYTSMNQVDLFGGSLRGANLYLTFLMEANLENADLRDANLQAAQFHFANLRGANLRSVDLRGASLAHADLREADLTGANLAWVDLEDAYGVAMDVLKRQRYHWTQEELLSQIDQAEKLAARIQQNESDQQQNNLIECRDQAFQHTVYLMKRAESLRFLDKEELKMLQGRVNEMSPGMWNRYRMHPRWRDGDL